MREFLDKLADAVPDWMKSRTDNRRTDTGDSAGRELASRIQFYEDSIDLVGDEIREMAPRRRVTA